MLKRLSYAGFLAALALTVTFAVAGQESTDYWEQIKHHLRASGQADSRQSPDVQQAYAYLESLSPQEMIIAGRQAAEEMSQYPSGDWPKASMNLGWFYQYYPQKTGDLEDVGPLLSEIEDRGRPAYWRWYLERLLTDEWEEEGRLSNEQRRRVSEVLLGVLGQKREHPAVAAQAARGVPRLLAGLKKDLPPLKEGAQPGKAHKELASLSRRYVDGAGAVLEREQAPPRLLRVALAGLVRVHQMSLAGLDAARGAVARAARSYAAYPEKLWPRIMLSAATMEADVDLASLLAEAQEAADGEETRQRLASVRALAAAEDIESAAASSPPE